MRVIENPTDHILRYEYRLKGVLSFLYVVPPGGFYQVFSEPDWDEENIIDIWPKPQPRVGLMRFEMERENDWKHWEE